jgi:hypothetical protein
MQKALYCEGLSAFDNNWKTLFYQLLASINSPYGCFTGYKALTYRTFNEYNQNAAYKLTNALLYSNYE